MPLKIPLCECDYITSPVWNSIACQRTLGRGKTRKMQISLEQEFLFYWLNLSLQEDSCIAKTEPGTSSSAVVIYSLKRHKNHDALKYSYVTGQKDTGTPLQHVTIWIGWGGSGGWLRRWEGARGRWRMTNAHLTF